MALGDLERAIMDVLWADPGPRTVRDVLQRVNADRAEALAYTTVMTVMNRLATKGHLARQPDGKAYRYSPVRSREQHVATLMGQVLQDAEDRSAALVHFAATISPEEAGALRRALARAQRSTSS